MVDSIMGSGKTTAILNMIKDDPAGSYIYVTPFLSEFERVFKMMPGRFKQPFDNGNGKLDYLHKLLASGEDIVTTHALFLKATPETIHLLTEGGYTLILDEALSVFQEYNENVKALDNKVVTKETVAWLIQEGHISVEDVDYSVKWNGSTKEGFQFSEVERLAKNGTLHCVDDTLYWEFPAEVFRAFPRIFILTYLFDGSILAAYMQIHQMPYSKVSAERTQNGSYKLCPYQDDAKYRKKLISLMNIYAGELNRIGNKHNAFSLNWLKGMSGDRVRTVKNAMRQYKRQMHASTNNIMWTSIKQSGVAEKFEAVKGFKYVRHLSAAEKALPEDMQRKLRCFVSCTARATNDFSDRTTLLYLANRYLNPEIKKYFCRCGSPIDEEVFAISELVQWVWRSAIRKGQPINLYIPSSRMRRLLYKWLGSCEADNAPRTKKVLEKA